MSNPQDSPKTERELAERIEEVACRAYQTRLSRSVALAEIYDLIQSYIDAQKAEVTEKKEAINEAE